NMEYKSGLLGTVPLLGIRPDIALRLALNAVPSVGQLQFMDSAGVPAVVFRQWHEKPLGDDLDEETPTLEGCDLLLRGDLFANVSRAAQRRPVNVTEVTHVPWPSKGE